MTEQEHILADQARVEQSAGQILKRAREAAGLSVEEVANRLNLLPSVILELEAGDFSRIRAEVFVQGYLRNYARLLHLPSEPLVDNYKKSRNKNGRSGSQSVNHQNVSNHVPVWKKWLAAVTSNGKGMVFIVVCAGLIFWVMQRNAVSEPASLPDQVTVETVDGVTVVDMAAGSSEHPPRKEDDDNRLFRKKFWEDR